MRDYELRVQALKGCGVILVIPCQQGMWPITLIGRTRPPAIRACGFVLFVLDTLCTREYERRRGRRTGGRTRLNREKKIEKNFDGWAKVSKGSPIGETRVGKESVT